MAKSFLDGVTVSPMVLWLAQTRGWVLALDHNIQRLQLYNSNNYEQLSIGPFTSRNPTGMAKLILAISEHYAFLIQERKRLKQTT